MAGQEPLKRGYEGILPAYAFKLLVIAAESHIQTQQLNGITVGQKMLISLFNAVCNITLDGKSKESDNMFERVMKSRSVTLNADVAAAIEERRLLWTNYDNLFTWFIHFKAFLIKFKFCGYDKETGTINFTLEQLHRIVNIDETEISLDGSKTIAGGRPAVCFFDPNLPLATKSAKSSLKCTGIFGSSAAGEPVPPHFQLPTQATERKVFQEDKGDMGSQYRAGISSHCCRP